MSNTPSNTEAWDLWLESITGGHHPASLAKFARAVLAKWGTHQPVPLGFTIENRAGIYVLVWEDGGCQPATSAEVAMWKALSAVRQPVELEPLSEQDVLGGLMATPNSVLENCADAFEAGVRFAERAHGIAQRGGKNE